MAYYVSMAPGQVPGSFSGKYRRARLTAGQSWKLGNTAGKGGVV